MSSSPPAAAEPKPPCWICGAPADTREHRTKASDLRSLFGIPTQRQPLYFHTDRRQNFKVGSLKADVLKFSNRICGKCNSARTQEHDFAWQALSEYLRNRKPRFAAGNHFRPSRIFPYRSKRAMLNVHLYFLKVFGCLIREGNIPIDTKPFAKVILEGTPHPNLYLAFGRAASGTEKIAGGSDVNTAMLDGKCAFATWFYNIGTLWVNVLYALDGERRRDGLVGAWHPRLGSRRILMKQF